MTSDEVDVRIVRLDPGVDVPRYARQHDAGADLATTIDVVIGPGQRVVVGTGISLALPPGFVGLVHPRSGLAAREGLTIVNSPGTVDAGYRGEIRVCLLNTDLHRPITLHRGDLVAQLVIQRVATARFVEVDALPPSDRGEGGYGSSGGVAGWRSVASDQTIDPRSMS